MARHKALIRGQALTWVGPALPAQERDVVKAGDVGVFEDYEGDPDHYVVEFNGAVFCCKATDVVAEPQPPVVTERRHNAT